MDEKPISTSMSVAILATLLSVAIMAVLGLHLAQPMLSMH